MTREIKFRVWHKATKQMYYHVDVRCDGSLKVWDDKGDNGQLLTGILEQFTGLKDKNGVEIYQGSLVKSRFGNVYEVVLDEFGYHFKAIGEKTRHRERCGCCLKSEAWEVIGNIHTEDSP